MQCATMLVATAEPRIHCRGAGKVTNTTRSEQVLESANTGFLNVTGYQ